MYLVIAQIFFFRAFELCIEPGTQRLYQRQAVGGRRHSAEFVN